MMNHGPERFEWSTLSDPESFYPSGQVGIFSASTAKLIGDQLRAELRCGATARQFGYQQAGGPRLRSRAAAQRFGTPVQRFLAIDPASPRKSS